MRLRRGLFAAILSAFPLASFLACVGDDPTFAGGADPGVAAADAPMDAGSTWC
jgi:hypothetical protein